MIRWLSHLWRLLTAWLSNRQWWRVLRDWRDDDRTVQEQKKEAWR